MLEYEKHKWCSSAARFVTIGRAGSEDELARALREAGLPAAGDATHVLGPTLDDVSSTMVRAALAAGDTDALAQLVPPAVRDFLVRRLQRQQL